MKRLLLVLVVGLLLSGCGPRIETAAFPAGVTHRDEAGDLDAPHADVLAFRSRVEPGDILEVTFTLADLPEALPRNREGVTAGQIDYAWRAKIWLDGKVTHLDRPDYLMQALYTSTGTNFRDATPLDRLLESGVWKHTSADNFFRHHNVAVTYDVEANTLTLRSRIEGINAQSVVLFETVDGLVGTDTNDWLP